MSISVALPSNFANKRFKKKANNLGRLRDDLAHINVEPLVDIPLASSESLRLYMDLMDSLKLDIKNINNLIEG